MQVSRLISLGVVTSLDNENQKAEVTFFQKQPKASLEISSLIPCSEIDLTNTMLLDLAPSLLNNIYSILELDSFYQKMDVNNEQESYFRKLEETALSTLTSIISRYTFFSLHECSSFNLTPVSIYSLGIHRLQN